MLHLSQDILNSAGHSVGLCVKYSTKKKIIPKTEDDRKRRVFM